jgi:SH3-like domain-containing protein
MFLRALAPTFLVLTLLAALPAAAEAICDPPRGTRLTVTGVAANDTLNMRREPSASAQVVSQIAPNERGVTATGRTAWARGQCTTTCQGAEGGLNDRGRAIAFGCKADGNIWYEVRRSNGTTGWANARFLDLASGGTTTPSRPVIETRVTFNCLTSGRMTVEIHRGGGQADVTISGKTYRLLRRENQSMRYSFQSSDGARLLGGRDLVEWRWPNGNRVNCIR